MWSASAGPLPANASRPGHQQARCRGLCHHRGWPDHRRFLHPLRPRLVLADLPEAVAKKLPRYPNVPATLLGRLAVSQDFRGHGLGELLLVDAFRRVLVNSREVASAAVVVDAKDERARNFYLRHDFIPLPSQPNRLFYLVKTIAKLFQIEPL